MDIVHWYYMCATFLLLLRYGQNVDREVSQSCVSACEVKIHDEWQPDICKNVCRDFKEYQGNEQIESPSVPSVIKTGFRSIEVTWNTRNISSLAPVVYVLELRPIWTSNNWNEIHPFVMKYYEGNDTIYTVDKLVAATGYQFRVLSISNVGVSLFSNWSEIFRTNSSCSGRECGVGDMRLELALADIPRGMARLEGVFRWEPNKDIPFRSIKLVLDLEKTPSHYCNGFFDSYGEFIRQDSLTQKNKSFHEFKAERDTPGLYAEFYFNCNYRLQFLYDESVGFFPKYVEVDSWTFHIPECLKFLNACGCTQKSIDRGTKPHVGDILFTPLFGNKSAVEIIWTGERWRNSTYVIYYSIDVMCPGMSHTYHKTVVGDGSPSYSAFLNVTNDVKCNFKVTAFNEHNCSHVDVEKADFVATYPCVPNPCNKNMSCERVGYRSRKYKCECIDGFLDFEGVCKAIPSSPVSDSSALSSGDVTAIVISVVLVLMIVIGIFICQHTYMKNKLRSLRGLMNTVFYSIPGVAITNTYEFQPSVVNIPMNSKELTDDREPNVLYVPQEIVDAFARGLTDGVFEVTRDRLKLGQVIGRGAFGEVHVADAILSDNHGWHRVAVKRLSDCANDEQIEDFIAEMELMKKIGEHENVIRMYGCCPKSPLCLIMEYAACGSLDKYLRALKQKCLEACEVNKNPEQNISEKVLDPNRKSNATDDPRNQYVNVMRENNKEVAAQVNEKIKMALDPKELESFARQIANGMAHLASLGIIHRDLAARNILMDDNHVLKISDFGLSRENLLYVKRTHGMIPLRWVSIEAIQERTYSTASDVWSFGIVLWEICTLGDVPYPSIAEKDLLLYLVAGNRMSKPESCTKEIYEIMMKCWSHRPRDRPTFVELVRLLWGLEHDGSSYVNIDMLMKETSNDSSIKDEGKKNFASEKKSEALDDTGFVNAGFSDEDRHGDDYDQHALPRKNTRQDGNNGIVGLNS